jgi:hypothetical protein
MGRWIFTLILAGAGNAAAAEDVRRTLSVTATVVESCTVSTAAIAPITCSRGTLWTRAKTAGPLLSAASPQSVQQGATYLTVTY